MIVKNIIFIGGIHGSGKGRICQVLKNKFHLTHLTASKVLKWDELSSQEEKKVENINYTQDRLIINLKNIIEHDKNYLLDGHYCLLNKDNVPKKVPLSTFKKINPYKLLIVYADPNLIVNRLRKRDNKNYDIQLIDKFQNLEIESAKEISKILQVQLEIIDSENFDVEKLKNI